MLDNIAAKSLQDQLNSNNVIKIKNRARKSFPQTRRVVMSKEDEKVIDELLEDSSDESVAPVPPPPPAEPNNIVQFAGAGFATWTDKHDNEVEMKDINHIKQENGSHTNISVPRPLPELQKIFTKDTMTSSQNKSKNREIIECVDLCSSDEE